MSRELGFSLITTAPTLRQRQLALGAVAVLLVALAAVGPFGALQLQRLNSFVPAIAAINLVANLATAALLFSQFSITGRRALLVLANGYLFSALIVIPWCLTFPGAIAPISFPAAGLQSTPWLYIFWTFGFAAAVAGYAWLKKDANERGHRRSRRSALGWSLVAVIGLVAALTWGVTAGTQLMPGLFAKRD
jgi:hypothetical protein